MAKENTVRKAPSPPKINLIAKRPPDDNPAESAEPSVSAKPIPKKQKMKYMEFVYSYLQFALLPDTWQYRMRKGEGFSTAESL